MMKLKKPAFALSLLIALLAACTSLESVVEACHNQGGHAVVVVNPDVTVIRGVRCEYPI